MARILFVTSSYPSAPGDGVCGYLHDLAVSLCDDRGHQLVVVAPPSQSGCPDAAFTPVSVCRADYRWPAARRLTAEQDSGAAVQGCWAARAEAVSLTAALSRAASLHLRHVDLVCSHWLVPSGLAVRRRLHVPHVAVTHGGDLHLLSGSRAGRRLARFVLNGVDRVVAVSDDLARRLEQLAPGTACTVAPMGAELGPPAEAADVRAFRHQHGGADGMVALFLGRLHAIKAVDVLIEAASLVSGCRLWIAGEGPERATLRRLAEARGIDAWFLGQLDRRRRRIALDACDVVAVPSRIEASGRSEGMPVVVAEALAAGRPLVATAAGGIPEVIEDGRNGLLVPPDDASALAQALLRLACCPRLRETLARGTSISAERLSMRATAAVFDGIFTELIGARA